MSLRVWLPLTGHLNNQGASGLSAVVTGTTSYAEGKLGEGLSCNGSSYWTISNLNLGNEASVCCWTKTTVNGKMSWVINCTVSNRLNLYENNYYTLNTGDGNDNPFKTDAGATITVLHDGKWHHFAVVFHSDKVLLYIDGEYKGRATTYKNPSATNGYIRIAGGYNNNHNYDWNGMINDFRLYDHALSLSEIIELSQGLALHYPLDSPYGTALTNRYSYPYSKGTPSSSHAAYTRTYNEEEGCTNYNFSFTGTGSSSWPSFNFPAFAFTAGKTYLWSLKVRTNACSSNYSATARQARISNDWERSFAQIVNSSRVGKGWQEFHVLQTLEATSTRGGTEYTTSPRLEIYPPNLNIADAVYTADFDIKDVMICETDEYVPFIENAYNTGGIIDTSGYGHNGAISGGVAFLSDSHRYTGSLDFDGTTGVITCTDKLPQLTGDPEFTYSVWIKCKDSSWPTAWKGIIRYGNITTNYSVAELLLRSGKVSLDFWNYRYEQNTASMSVGKWHHIVSTKTSGAINTTIKLYIDGVEVAGTGNSTSAPDIKDTNAQLAIGNMNSSERYFNGQISDVRIYSTALSANEVKSLYETSMKVDNEQSIHVYEINEESGTTKIGRNGVLETDEFNEETIAKISNDFVSAREFIEM